MVLPPGRGLASESVPSPRGWAGSWVASGRHRVGGCVFEVLVGFQSHFPTANILGNALQPGDGGARRSDASSRLETAPGEGGADPSNWVGKEQAPTPGARRSLGHSAGEAEVSLRALAWAGRTEGDPLGWADVG